MKIFTMLVQYPVSFVVKENLAAICNALDTARPGDLVVCPEGGVSGYSRDVSFLAKIEQEEVESALQMLSGQAMQRGINLWVGACVQRDACWYNVAFGLTQHGTVHEYQKVNLATHERGTFTAGDTLPIFELGFPAGQVRIGVQLCRELRYPEQWGWLARKGGQVILHLNNAQGNPQARPVWRSLLISRAAETGRFVLSVNNGAPGRQCPTMAVAPDGQLLGEVAHKGTATLRVELDLARVSDWYISQCREDVAWIGGQ
jgi:predicted amidohydrolase